LNFDFTDDQKAIKRTAHDFLAARYTSETIRELARDDRGFTDAQWQALVELGWPGVIVPEEHDGLGLGAVELIVIAEEMGYGLAPSPLQSNTCAALLLIAAGIERQRRRWLEPLARGELRGTVAVWDERAGWAPDRSEAESTDGALTATKIAVPDAVSADFVIIAGADRRHYLVETVAPAVQIVAEESLDLTRKLFTVRLDGAPVEPLDHAPKRVEHAYATIVTALAAENVGVAQRAMEMAVAYPGDRKQFGRPIGAYQAVSHRCAQMLLEVESARSLSYWAAWALDHEPQSAVPGMASALTARRERVGRTGRGVCAESSRAALP
jgi:alkylation response protein AidB-like acyl-CoA dehydrogenase